jgi:aminoglycoside phosphotransferase (APT) family kinase protein
MEKTISSTAPLDVESLPSLMGYLRRHGLILTDERAHVTILQGGVSNKTVLVEPTDSKPFVIKQALGKLRVAADWHCDPARIHREAQALRYLPALTPAGTITPLFFEDTVEHVISMEAVPAAHENWKTMLLSRGPKPEHIVQFAEVLAAIHRRSSEQQEMLRGPFGDRTWFNVLRLEPYYQFTGDQVTEARAFLANLIRETLHISLALVHGDYSPKNVLIHASRFVLLDHEVAHFGDPAFDVGFSLTHLLSKAHHCRERRSAFFAGSELYAAQYLARSQGCDFGSDFEARTCRHTLACLLARVSGRSPLEYLSDPEKVQQRAIALVLMSAPPRSLINLIHSFKKELECRESKS